jgi:DNA processing protein
MEQAVRQLTKDEYPRRLLEIPEPPPDLWIQGTLPDESHAVLAVVGSRALSHYGREATTALLEGLRGYPITIVSGLALGADQHAHEEALRIGLNTIAVPGSGLDERVIAPRSNAGLAKRILASGGALLSEHEPMHTPYPHDFPSRNRIMVGLSDAVLMIEAGERSGTLITARLATEYNRDLLCVPHRIGDVHSEGSHQFIRLGATLVSEPSHILEALGIEALRGADSQKLAIDLTEYETTLYALLETPTERDTLIRTSRLSSSDALTALVSLEIKGLAEERFGMWRRL